VFGQTVDITARTFLMLSFAILLALLGYDTGIVWSIILTYLELPCIFVYVLMLPSLK